MPTSRLVKRHKVKLCKSVSDLRKKTSKCLKGFLVITSTFEALAAKDLAEETGLPGAIEDTAPPFAEVCTRLLTVISSSVSWSNGASLR